MKVSSLLLLFASVFILTAGASHLGHQPTGYDYSPPEENMQVPDTFYSTPEESVEEPVDLNLSYSTSYAVSDAFTLDEKQAEETLENGITVGSYQYVRPDGVLQIVRYTVTPEGGFQAVVEEQPGYADPFPQVHISKMSVDDKPQDVYQHPEPEGLYMPPKPESVYMAPIPEAKPQDTYIPPMEMPQTIYITPDPEPAHIDQLYTAPEPVHIDQLYTAPEPVHIDQLYTAPEPVHIDQLYSAPDPDIQEPNQLYSTPVEDKQVFVSEWDYSNDEIVRVSSAHFAPNPLFAQRPSVPKALKQHHHQQQQQEQKASSGAIVTFSSPTYSYSYPSHP